MVCRLYNGEMLSAKFSATTPLRALECMKRLQVERLRFIVFVLQEISSPMLDWLDALGRYESLDCMAYILLPGAEVPSWSSRCLNLNLENAYSMRLSEMQDFVGALRLLYQIKMNARN